MSFAAPFWLLFVPAVLLLFWFIKEKETTIPLPSELLITRSSAKTKFLPLLLVLLLLALARPVYKEPLAMNESIQPLFVALDVSASMNAQDIKPSRLAFAKKAIRDLIQKSHKKIALLVFTSNPLIIAPPTSDKVVLLEALESFNPKNVLTHSTSIQKLLDFVSKFQGKIDLALFSDGGEEKMIQKPKNIRLHYVMIGTKEGAFIPTNDGYLKKDGKPVVTRINEALAKYADFTYSPQNYLDILQNTKVRISKQKSFKTTELFFVPLLLAIALTLYIFTTMFESFKKLLPILIIMAPYLHASLIEEIRIKQAYKAYIQKDFNKSAQIFATLPYQETKWGEAMSLMQLGKYKKALNILKEISTTDPNLKANIYEALGRCYEKIRRYDKALHYYVLSAQRHPKKELLAKIEALALKKLPKKLLLPFSKQKRVLKKEPGKKGKKSKSAGSSNLQSAALGANSKGGKRTKKRSEVVVKKGSSMPLGSRLYELINKGYIHEKNPW